MYRLAALSLLVAACSLPYDSADPPPAGALRGELVTHVFDYAGNRSEIRHALRLPSGEERELRFAERPEIASGTVIDVWGRDAGGTLMVERFSAVERGIVSALVDGPAKKARRWAFVLVANGAGAGNYGVAAATQQLFSQQVDSIKSYYNEV